MNEVQFIIRYTNGKATHLYKLINGENLYFYDNENKIWKESSPNMLNRDGNWLDWVESVTKEQREDIPEWINNLIKEESK